MPSEQLIIKLSDREFSVVTSPKGQAGVINIDGEIHPFTLEKLTEGTVSLLLDGRSYLFAVSQNEAGCKIGWSGGEVHLEIEDERARMLKKFLSSASTGKGITKVKAPMPGLVVKIIAQIGAQVKKGEPLIVVEAMKMENEIAAPSSGKVVDIKVQEKQAVEKNEVMVVIESE